MAHRIVRLLLVAVVLALMPAWIVAHAAEPALIVKFRSTGEAAVDACAEQIARSGSRFSSATRDRSASLDILFAGHGLGSPRVLFPSGENGKTLADRREALANRFARRAAARLARADTVRRPLPDLSPIYRVALPAGSDVQAALEALAADPHVEYVQRDHERSLDQVAPPLPALFDDPYLTLAGSWGQPYLDLWGLYAVHVPEVWPRAQGEGIVVAVVDTGLDASHPDIAANVWVNPGEDLDGDDLAEVSDRNGIDDDQNGLIDDLTGFDFANSVDANEDGDFDDPGDLSDADPSDDNGHGTHVAGTIAAVAGNGIGIVGVAPRARIMALKGFPAEGSANDSVLWRAVLHAAENGASVVNNSWSCGSPCPSNPLAEEVLELVEALGTVVVTSAGNQGTDVAFYSPENGRRVITVGAIGADESLPDLTNRGWLVDLVAPGAGPEEPSSVPVARRNILSLRARDTFTLETRFIVDGDYLRLAGTSMSSPHVAGAVAVLRGLRPELTPADIRTLIRRSARDLGDAGHDPEFGAGLLAVDALVDAPIPDVELELAAPRVGLIHDPASGFVELRGVARGSDIAAVELAVARGLSGRDFQPIEAFGSSTFEWEQAGAAGVFLAQWDVGEVGDGPYVIRARARMRDGRSIDDYTIVGIERNSPVQISHLDGDASNPQLAGRSLVWQVDDADGAPGDHDLALGRFPDPRRPQLGVERILARPGNQFGAVRDGLELAWLEPSEATRAALLRCRIDVKGRCEPMLVSSAPGSFGPVFLAGGWLVWARTNGNEQFVEGCALGSSKSGCVPQSLIDPASGLDWSLHSFDGKSLLASGSGSFVRCRVDASKRYCSPEEIFFQDEVSPIEPRLAGDLVAFSRVEIERIRPPGCATSDPRPSCARRFIAVVEYLACAIDSATSICDPIVVSDKQPTERAHGIAVSSRRVVWSMGGADEEPAVYFCEFEPTLRECRSQRVGGILAPQKAVTVDGARLAWLDGRDGAFAVRGLELPSLDAPSTLKVRAGVEFSISFDTSPGSSSDLRYEIEGLSGVTPAQANARVFDPGPPGGVVLLRGALPIAAPTQTSWRLRATGGGGLWSESVIDLISRPAPRAEGPSSSTTTPKR